MQYSHLKSLFVRNKRKIALAHPREFFKVHDETGIYIEPTLEKIEFADSPPPAIVLISAVGATGKTRLAKDLSLSAGFPLLDLSLCDPVGKSTLTGIITDCYGIDNVSLVLKGLAEGTYGIIIDAVDEGRAKTNRDAFNAFLDNLIERLSPEMPTARTSPTFIVLGRSAILEDCWYYLDNKKIGTALAGIEPFSMDSARRYIDSFTDGLTSRYRAKYESTRNKLLQLLQASFTGEDDSSSDSPSSDGPEFLRFLGYPPVLDSIVALLKENANYYALDQKLNTNERTIEASQIYRIATYVLERERTDKVLPIVRDRQILAGVPDGKLRQAEDAVFTVEEQCARLVAACLEQEIDVKPMTADLTPQHKEINRQYNEALADSGFLPEHPFLEDGTRFRNDVFKSLALAKLFLSNDEEYRMLASEYARNQKNNYHLVYMLSEASEAQEYLLHADCLPFVFDSALEFRSVRATRSPGVRGTNRIHSVVDVEVQGAHWQEAEEGHDPAVEISIDLRRSGGDPADATPTSTTGAAGPDHFRFRTKCEPDTNIELGVRLAGIRMTVPCVVSVGSREKETEMMAPVVLSAREVKLGGDRLRVGCRPGAEDEDAVVVECGTLSGFAEVSNRGGCELAFVTDDNSNSHYSVVKYVSKPEWKPPDPDTAQKFLRMKRILLEFRSHGKGGLARYCEKIDGQRVLKNKVGEAVRDKLIRDGVMYRKEQHYHLNTSKLRDMLGVSWSELRGGKSSEAMREYLANLEVPE